MTPRARLDAVFSGREPDRTPVLGGWIAAPERICAIAGVRLEEYWEAPIDVSIEAYRRLGADGLIDAYVPARREDYRCVDEQSYRRAIGGMSLDEAVARIDAMPGPSEIETAFDFDAEYETFRRGLVDMQRRCGDMLWMPAQWAAGACVSWYSEFGYENFFNIIGLHEDRARKLMEVGGARGRLRGRVIARAVEEGLYPRACLLGEDICSQRGPMVSPEFLEKHYAPQLRYGLEPLLAAGCKPVWHCDGDVRPLLDMLLDCGVKGFQGFQPECGMTVEMIAGLRTREGEPLVIFGPLSVTTELPVLSPEGVAGRVRRAIEVCRGRALLVVFTANTINPDVPLENIRAMYEAVREG